MNTASNAQSLPFARIPRFLIPAGALVVALPFVPMAAALFAGVAIAILWGNPFTERTRPLSRSLLMLGVVGLGANMDLGVVLQVGAEGLGQTAISIAVCLVLSMLLARLFGAGREVGLLIGVGTAICGGSAIAAVAPILRTRDQETSVALATVFILNAAALVLFPLVGRAVGLDPAAFGQWAALAIHDTSSVVGAAMSYAPDSVDVATTLKLTRALWILPLSLVLLGVARKSEGSAGRAPRPWFILGFLVAAALVTWIPALRPAGAAVAAVAKRAMAVALFFIGAGLSRDALRAVGVRPLAMGIVLWVLVAFGALVVIRLS